MKRWKVSDLNAVVEKFGDNVKVFSFAGSLYRKAFEGIPKNDGFPKVVDTYDTVAHGTLERFVPGEHTVIEDEFSFARVAEQYVPGNEFVESQYIAIYARHDMAKIVADTLNNVGFFFSMPAFSDGRFLGVAYSKQSPYTVFYKASPETALNGFVRDNQSDEYLFAQVENGKIIGEWKNFI